MATFPAAIPTFTDLDPNLTLGQNSHTARHNKVHAELAALLAKVGINSSTDVASLDYKVAAVAGSIAAHAANTSNPHAVTKAQVGLGNVDNTSDAIKLSATLQAVYPVGSLYMNASDSTNPATLFGFGIWVSMGPYVPVGYTQNDPNFGTPGATVGSTSHAHTAGNYQTLSEIFTTGGTFYIDYLQSNAVNYQANIRRRVSGSAADESNSETQNSGIKVGGTSDIASSIQPSVVVYMWKRTA